MKMRLAHMTQHSGRVGGDFNQLRSLGCQRPKSVKHSCKAAPPVIQRYRTVTPGGADVEEFLQPL